MPADLMLHAAFNSRGAIAFRLCFLVPCLVMAIGVPLIYRSARWAGHASRSRPADAANQRGEPLSPSHLPPMVWLGLPGGGA